MRTKPYTIRGLNRVPCFKCGRPSSQQWQICSLNNEYKGLCVECDVDLNRTVLEFMGLPKRDIIIAIAIYRETLQK